MNTFIRLEPRTLFLCTFLLQTHTNKRRKITILCLHLLWCVLTNLTAAAETLQLWRGNNGYGVGEVPKESALITNLISAISFSCLQFPKDAVAPFLLKKFFVSLLSSFKTYVHQKLHSNELTFRNVHSPIPMCAFWRIYLQVLRAAQRPTSLSLAAAAAEVMAFSNSADEVKRSEFVFFLFMLKSSQNC